MALKVGAEDTGKVGAKGSGAPDPGTNQVVTQESYLAAVKEITAATTKVKLANEERKNVRKKWKASGIELGVLDATVRLAEWSRGEIRDHFSVQANYALWLGLPVAPGVLKQGDMAGLDDNEIQRREWFAIGRTASRSGKPGKPPEECPEEFHQAFMSGFNEEDEAAWLDSETADTREAAAASPQPDKGAGDAAPDPAAVVDWTVEGMWKGFSEDPEEWFAAQRRDFDAAYDGLPAGATVRIGHPGVLAAFRAAREEEATAAQGRGEAADVPVLEGEGDQTNSAIWGEGFDASKANQPRDGGGYEGDEAADFNAGWDAHAAKELEDRGAKAAATAAADAKPAKGLH